MSRRRAGMVAIQAVVVAALMVVVYLTLLQPEGGDMPPGLEASGPTETAGGEPGAGSSYVRQRTERARDANRDGARGGGSGPLAPASIDATGPIAPAAGKTAPGVDDPEDISPTDDQYADTLARLSDNLY